jgi:hypothetical protein
MFFYQPNYPDMELLYSAFTSHRAKRLQTTRKLIEEVICRKPDQPLKAHVSIVRTPGDPLDDMDDDVSSMDTDDKNNKKFYTKNQRLGSLNSSDLVAKCKNLFEMQSLKEKRQMRTKQKVQFLTRTNKQRFFFKPMYGKDLQDYVDHLLEPLQEPNNTFMNGFANCLQVVRSEHERAKPKIYWSQTDALVDMLSFGTYDYFNNDLKDMLQRFIMYIAPVECMEHIQFHVAHPSPSLRSRQVGLIEVLNSEVRTVLKATDNNKYVHLNRIQTAMAAQFPEKRLIQYDCGKLQSLDILLHRLYADTHRVLLFTQMTRMLDILENFLNYHGYKYLRLDGTTTIEQRQVLMERFNSDKRIFCFILSTRSGGIGVNLTGADTVIFYDSDWNPTMDAQAQDRCHRIGQTRDVHIYRLISEKTVEENILKKANQKRLLSDVTIEGGCFTTALLKKHHITELFHQPTGFVEDSDSVGSDVQTSNDTNIGYDSNQVHIAEQENPADVTYKQANPGQNQELNANQYEDVRVCLKILKICRGGDY